MTDIVEHSKTAWEIASRYSGVLASETRDLAAAIDRALAAERLRAASEWRDISTAPRDTKAFLVWVPENQCTFQVSRTDRGLCIFGGDHRDYLDRATHWMPLPAPPQRNEVKK